jgi:phosphotransferase system HPr (HPr) family protein
MVEKQVKVANTDNHEFELATMIVQMAGRFSSLMSIVMRNKKVNAKSIMGMMSLGLMEDDVITIVAEGEDEDEALSSLEGLLLGTGN